MFKNTALFVSACTFACTSLAAQTPLAPPAPVGKEAIVPLVAQQASTSASAELPANTEILLSMNEALSTKGGKLEEGTSFRLSLVNDVKLGEFVVIPRGTPAVGEVTWKTGKGAFGKSGKMEIALRYLDLQGRHIPLNGTYRQEGEGNTVATVAGVIAAGVFAGFITGKSATIPQGRELKAYTTEALPVALPAGASIASAPAAAPVIAATPALPVQPAALTTAATGSSGEKAKH